jgi:hypothetical protein
MKNRVIKGITMALCLSMMVPAAVCTMPGMGILAEAEENTAGNSNANTEEKSDEELLAEAKTAGKNALDDYQRLIDSGNKYKKKLDDIITKAKKQIDSMKTTTGVSDYVSRTKANMDSVVNPPKDEDDDDDNEDDSETTTTADHFLMVGGSWVTPVANAGQMVSIVLPVVNMGRTDVTKAVVTPVLSTDTSVWPFEITSSNYSQTISDLPGTDTGISDMDRRRELTWNLQTRSDVGNGYQKISFDVRYQASDGTSQTTTLDTYIQVSGTSGVSADGKAAIPRVIVTGFETEPATVHAGESFLLTLHLKNTSTATSVSNMIFSIEAAVDGKDTDTTYAAFLPTAGSSTIFVDKIEKNGTKDIQIELEAKSDLAQKPYAVDVNMSYNDEHVNEYTNTTSVSIPVKQEASVEVSDPEITPSSINVGSEANVMFNIYNMGKTKLYNVQVKTEGDTVSGGEAFVGNIESGATGAVDIYVTGQSATMDDGIIKLLISYEDETGEATTIEKEITLYVNEEMMDEYIGDEDDMMDDMNGNSGKGSASYIVVLILLLAAACVAVFLVIRKKKKKKEQESLEEDLLDLDDDDTEL